MKCVWNGALFPKKTLLLIFMLPLIHIALLCLQAWIYWEFFLPTLLQTLKGHQVLNFFFQFPTLLVFQSFMYIVMSHLWSPHLVRLHLPFPVQITIGGSPRKPSSSLCISEIFSSSNLSDSSTIRKLVHILNSFLLIRLTSELKAQTTISLRLVCSLVIEDLYKILRFAGT